MQPLAVHALDAPCIFEFSQVISQRVVDFLEGAALWQDGAHVFLRDARREGLKRPKRDVHPRDIVG